VPVAVSATNGADNPRAVLEQTTADCSPDGRFVGFDAKTEQAIIL
jgi:hypothetical protein